VRIITVQFDYNNSTKYHLLSKVFEESCRTRAPEAKFEIVRIKEPAINKGRIPSVHGAHSDTSNTEKLGIWLDCMNRAEEGENIIFADCDMLMLNNPECAFDADFDIGVTRCTSGGLPFNGGIVFAKNHKRARALMALWEKTNTELYNDPIRHKAWSHGRKPHYAGMNQAAWGCVWEEKLKLTTAHKENQIYKTDIATIKLFPCRLWNAVRIDWPIVDPNKTYFVHIKSEMRPRCVSRSLPVESIEPKYREIVTIWRSYANKLGLDLPAGGVGIKRPKNTPISSSGALVRFKYPGYDKYIEAQIKTTTMKMEGNIVPWVKKQNIQFLSEFLKKTRGDIAKGICHGTRTGEEQKYFRVFLKADVIGTEICEKATSVPNTVIWDFNKEKPDWIGKFDFVYSNSFDHSYKPSETLKIWMGQLKPTGVIILEYTTKHNKPLPTISDPVCFSAAEMIAAVTSWTNGKWKVTANLNGPQTKTINGVSEIVKFLIIERSDNYAKNHSRKK
jgi:hypothetical protein